eukprot:7333662-Pyramimonas_sp.AAC.1
MFIDLSVALGTLLRGCSRHRGWGDTVSGMWFAAADQGHILNAFRAPRTSTLQIGLPGKSGKPKKLTATGSIGSFGPGRRCTFGGLAQAGEQRGALGEGGPEIRCRVFT